MKNLENSKSLWNSYICPFIFLNVLYLQIPLIWKNMIKITPIIGEHGHDVTQSISNSLMLEVFNDAFQQKRLGKITLPHSTHQMSRKGTSLEDGELAFKSLLQTRHKTWKHSHAPIEG